MHKKVKNIPILDTVTLLLPGERWKDIPEFEGMYQLSSYGRLRSLSRWVYSANRPDAFRPGRIKKPHISQKSANEINVQMKLHKDGSRFMFSVARFVYYLFVARFNIHDHSFVVSRKDKDILNCYYKNLQLRSLSELAKEGYEKNIRSSIFQLQVKPVSQYSLEGKYIQTYACAKDAAKSVGVSSEYINDAARRKVRPTAGSYWRYGPARSFINVAKLKKRRENASRIVTKKVKQLTLSGKLIRIYNSVGEASKAIGNKSATSISWVCMGKQHSSKGYKWEYVNPGKK